MDDKGRVVVPSQFREVIDGDGIMLTRMDHTLYAYPMDKWREVEARFAKREVTTMNFRRLRRFFLGGAQYCPFDKQNRILIPPGLRIYANLDPKEKVVFVGQGEHLEIWSESGFQSELEKFDQLAETEEGMMEISQMGL